MMVWEDGISFLIFRVPMLSTVCRLRNPMLLKDKSNGKLSIRIYQNRSKTKLTQFLEYPVLVRDHA